MAERVSSEQLMFKPTHNFYACMFYVVALYSLWVRGIKTDVLLNMARGVIFDIGQTIKESNYLISITRALLTYWLLVYW